MARSLAVSWRERALTAAVFLVVGFLLYGRVVTYDFVALDDSLLVYQNPAAQGLTLGNLWAAFTTFDPELYIPLTLLSYQIEYALGGGSAWISHLVNLLLHVTNALLVASLLGRLRGDRLLGLLGGLLFLVHPLHTETVSWVSARKDLLSAFFAFASVLSFLDALEGGGRWRWALSLGAFLLSLLAKVSGVLLPLVLLFLAWFQGRTLDHSLLRRLAPFATLSVVFVLIAFVGKGSADGADALTLALLGSASVLHALGKLFVPIHLSVVYPPDAPVTLASPFFLVAPLSVLAATALVWLLRRRMPILTFVWAWFLLFLAPSVPNLVKGLDVTLGSDRYVYIASFAVFLVLLAMLRWVASLAAGRSTGATRTITVLSTVVIGLPLATLTFLHLPVWRDSATLHAHILERAPNVPMAHVNLGNALRARGDFAEALEHYDRAIALRPAMHQAYYNRGIVLEERGEAALARQSYERATELAPGYALAWINLGRIEAASGRDEEARRAFASAAAAAEHLALLHFNLGVLAAKRGDFAVAVRHYRDALDRDPMDIGTRVNLAVAFLQLGRIPEAVALYGELRVDAPDAPLVVDLERLLEPYLK